MSWLREIPSTSSGSAGLPTSRYRKEVMPQVTDRKAVLWTHEAAAPLLCGAWETELVPMPRRARHDGV